MVIIKADGPVECEAEEDYRGHVEVWKHTLLKLYTPNASIMLILWSVAVVYAL